MAQLADEVVVAADAQIYMGDVGSSAPTNSYGAVDAAFEDLGYVSEDGFDLGETRDLVDIRAMQSFYKLFSLVNAKDFTLGFTLLQWNQNTISLALGGATVEYVGGEWHIEPPAPDVIDVRAFVFDWQQSGAYFRLYIPRAQMTSALTVKLARTSAAGLPVVVSAMPVSASDNPYELWISSEAFGS